MDDITFRVSDTTSSTVNLTRQQLVLRRQSNALVPVAHLPSETLSSIFKESCREDQAKALDGEVSQVKWPSVVHVCHHWRVVALGTPTLWNTILVDVKTPPEKLKEWIKRSGQTPLYVILRGSRTSSNREKSKLFNRALKELPRTRCLHTTVGFSALRWPKSTTSLKVLQMDDISRRVWQGTSYGGSGKAFGKAFHERFSALESLDIRDYGFDFKNWLLPSTLIQLEVRNRAPPPHGFSLRDVLESLRHLPSLRVLTLQNILPIDALRTLTDAEPVSLPLLETIHIYEDAAVCTTLLEHLEFPPTVNLRLSLIICNYEELEMNGIPPVSSYVARLSRLRSAYMCILDTRGRPGWVNPTYKFKAWKDIQSMDFIKHHAQHKAELDISIIFDIDGFGINFATLSPVRDLLAALPLSHIHTFYIDCSHGPLSKAPDVYRNMNELHTLVFRGQRMRPDITVKLADMLEQNASTIFPELRVFCADEVDFRGSVGRYRDVLRGRQNHAGDSTVVIRHCYNIFQRDVDVLQEAVPVDWDGYSKIVTARDRSAASSDPESDVSDASSMGTWVDTDIISNGSEDEDESDSEIDDTGSAQ